MFLGEIFAAIDFAFTTLFVFRKYLYIKDDKKAERMPAVTI